MKAYKLIKEYPSLPCGYRLGAKVRKQDIFGFGKYKMYEYVDLSNGLSPSDVEKYPEYWQEIDENYHIYYFADTSTFESVDSFDKNYSNHSDNPCKRFETEQQRDDFVLENKKQFSGNDMVSFAEYFKETGAEIPSLKQWLYNKQNGTN